ncbi:MAG: hypothetical protein HYX20_01890 [Candidatus Yanofskybacteria bacterium]|nr:hypothetical protein [Candidatus Yanofskybacteria bacterium]
MAEAFNHLGSGSVKQINDFAEQRIAELERRVKEDQSEIRMWGKIKKGLKHYLCCSCDGDGNVSTSGDPDGGSKTCLACKGSGEKAEELLKMY